MPIRTTEIDKEIITTGDPRNVTGELIEAAEAAETGESYIVVAGQQHSPELKTTSHQRHYVRYFLLPIIFLTVTLLGGLRISGVDGSLIFLKPALLCLIFASILLALFFRGGMINLSGWIDESLSTIKNVANGTILLTLFAASTQLFNSLIPEQGMPFWVVAFCFFWTLWNNLFADLDPVKLLRSLGGLFGLAFVAKYLVLANLTAPVGQSWLRAIIENPAQQTFTWLLDLPQFAAATGYIQFFAVMLYLLGLYLLPATTRDQK
ncbi:MAG: hypothetical protein H0V76_00610 [Blastocatellia bacterium]|nr:hypothetical protein [Blastocatellia bacterium]